MHPKRTGLAESHVPQRGTQYRPAEAGTEPNHRIEVTHGLKEWEPIIEAVRDGRQIVLVKAGGLLDYDGFSLPSVGSQYFVLYPAHYHNAEQFLKERYSHHLHRSEQRRNAGNAMDIVVTVSDIFECHSADNALKLSALYAWSDEYIRSKFKYQKKLPIQVLCVRAYVLERQIVFHSKNSGCKSWVKFDPPFSVNLAQPVLQDEEYAQSVSRVAKILGID